nr:general secretion pathway protein [Pseudomonas sp.]
LADMMTVHGVDGGLSRTRQRIESRIIVDVLRRALALHWTILLFAVGVLIAMTFWHFSVIDELRRALQAYYAAR